MVQQKFSLNVGSFMNIMRSDEVQELAVNYEPILVRSGIKRGIFGINSEKNFVEVKKLSY